MPWRNWPDFFIRIDLVKNRFAVFSFQTGGGRQILSASSDI
jgi:hypothetical protein